MTVWCMPQRYLAVGIQGLTGPRISKTQSNGRVNHGVHLRIDCFDTVLHCSGTVLTLFGTVLGNGTLRTSIWDPEN